MLVGLLLFNSKVQTAKKIMKRSLIKIKPQDFLCTYRFCDKKINRFCLVLQKGVYPYQYMDSWQRFNETLFYKKEFYSN